jgi:hypothetical protein
MYVLYYKITALSFRGGTFERHRTYGPFITDPPYVGDLNYFGTNGSWELLNGQSHLAVFAEGGFT